jgi:hypothetical protein
MGGSFQPPIRAAGPGRGFCLIALTSFYSPARRKACGYLFLTPRRQNILSESLRLGIENVFHGRRRQPRIEFVIIRAIRV